MVQNFAHFQQSSRPGAKGQIFTRAPEVPRCEAACVFCQRKDWIEQRHKIALFAEPPQQEVGRSLDYEGEGQAAEDTEDSGEFKRGARKSGVSVGLCVPH